MGGRVTEFGWRSISDKAVRFLFTVSVAMLTLFGFKWIGMSGGGTLAVLTLGATLQNWSESPDNLKTMDADLAKIWQKLGSVMLFTLLGASVNQSKLDASLLAV